ncbi:class I SAM-dependent methyltransferase [Paracoccus sp. XHP0099]|uniref:Class I SAM-dependent methyltransferase n=1 Tax=Paracoccus marinaquae TaxID=2841926 RepID=A0ABS6AHW1_9RHOB|nr:class I SAM-dependent methyltransferase [Paracoccus marinaquae]
MARRLAQLLTPESSLLDFGCGSGRYLLSLQGRVGRAAGYDISPAALALLRARAAARGWDELSILGPETAALPQYVAQRGQVDLVLCLFGVLAHITSPVARAEALERMRLALKPGSGRLLLSVPNIRRRFRQEQRQMNGAAPGFVRYRRRINGGSVPLNYQLFDAERLRRELTEAGFLVRRLGCESVLPESWIVNGPAARHVDGILTPICPLRWCYGIYAEASC